MAGRFLGRSARFDTTPNIAITRATYWLAAWDQADVWDDPVNHQ